MRRLGWILICLLGLTLVGGCASYFKRQECEKTNWFEYGRTKAMKGQRPSGDSFIGECEKAEAQVDHAAVSEGFKAGRDQYCLPEQVFQTGKGGVFFNPDLCDGPGLNRLKEKHAEGVAEFCQKSNGYAAGATGKPYNKICPKELEEAFLPEFRRGRKVYLTALVNEKEREIDSLDREVDDLNRQRTQLNYQLATLGSGRKMTRETKYDPVSRTYKEEITESEDPTTKERREDLMNQIRRLDGEIDSTRQKQRTAREEVRQLNTEIATL